jgi:hypothetical protein
MSSSLWSSSFNGAAFDWNTLFEQWSARSVMPQPLKTVRTNLKAATDPHNYHNPSISQFLNYMNFPAEQEGAYWLLHEIVASRWMYGEIRMDYVREIVNNIDIDIHFPKFPGAPSSSLTVREFLQSNLSRKEFESLHIASLTKDAYAVEDEIELEEEEDADADAACTHVSYPTTQILIIRNLDKHTLDDKIIITKVDDECYTFSYSDTNTSSGKMTCEKRDLNGREVIASLRYTLNFLVIDNEPFHSIQVLIPGLPSIILKTSEVTATNRDTIYDAMEMTMRNWPVKV